MRDWLQKLPPRERALLVGMIALLFAALVWWIAIAPALQTYRASAAAHAKLDAALSQMQTMAEEVKQLKATPRLGGAAVQTWLDGSIKRLGKATSSTLGGRANIQFIGASPEALAAWLAEARTAAQLVPTQVNLRRSAVGTKLGDTGGDILWDGTLTFELPNK